MLKFKYEYFNSFQFFCKITNKFQNLKIEIMQTRCFKQKIKR